MKILGIGFGFPHYLTNHSEHSGAQGFEKASRAGPNGIPALAKTNPYIYVEICVPYESVLSSISPQSSH
jgi:hypothetical protein